MVSGLSPELGRTALRSLLLVSFLFVLLLFPSHLHVIVDDQSGFMGYSYSSDDQQMCFNAPKNAQLGWFVGGEINFDPSTASSLTVQLNGIVDYNKTDGSSTPVMVRIASNTMSKDYYISFNRRTSFNSNTVEGANQVLIHMRNPGLGRATSNLIQKLSNGGQYTIDDQNSVEV